MKVEPSPPQKKKKTQIRINVKELLKDNERIIKHHPNDVQVFLELLKPHFS